MNIKHGASVRGLRPEALLGLFICSRIFYKHDQPMVLTSGTDGEHMRGSLHYVGQAFDLRLPMQGIREAMLREMREALGPEYDVIESTGCIHVEFQPKGRMP